jgi:hypothetical protein
MSTLNSPRSSGKPVDAPMDLTLPQRLKENGWTVTVVDQQLNEFMKEDEFCQ